MSRGHWTLDEIIRQQEAELHLLRLRTSQKARARACGFFGVAIFVFAALGWCLLH
jgi:hypothetical protein